MRILMFTYEFPPRIGGMQQMAFQLAKQFHALGHDVRVLTVRQAADTDFDARQSISIHRHSGEIGDNASPLKRIQVKWEAQLVFHKEVRAFKPDAILCPFWDPSGYIVALHSLTTLHVPYYVIGHGTELHYVSTRGLSGWAKKLLRYLTFRRAKGVFAVSRFTAKKIQETLGVPSYRVSVISNGISLEEVGKPDSAQRGAESLSPSLLTVCRLVPRKGCDTVIRALPPLLSIFPHIQYSIVGDGPELPRLKQLVVELDLESHVKFFGSLNDAEREQQYRKADVFVMAARQSAWDYEGFGIVFLEAMARGLPVIGANTGGIPDVIKDEATGLLVPPDDPISVAQAVRRLAEDAGLRSRLTTAAMQTLQDRFLWSTIAQQYVNNMMNNMSEAL